MPPSPHAISAIPELIPASRHRNLTDLFEQRVATKPNHPAVQVIEDGAWRTLTARELHARATALAKGLIAAGIRPGDRIAIVGPTRVEWTLADIASLYAGAVVVPMFDSAPASQMRAIIADADVRAAIVGTVELAATLRELLAEHRGDDAPTVWSMDTHAGSDLTALAAAGADVDDAVLEQHRSAAGLDDLATIVYTSGTTGRPKGARIVHRNLVHQILNVGEAYRDALHENGSTVLFLPLGHVLARALQWMCLARGMRFAHIARPKDAVGALTELKPTFLMVVPMVLEKIRQSGGDAAAEKHLGGPWRHASKVAIAWGTRGRSRTVGLRVMHAVYELLFYRRLRAVLGGKLEYLMCGAARLDPDTARFFLGVGIPLVEGYGLTESTAPLSGNRLDDLRPGTVGLPMPGMSVAVDEEGELLARGPGIFAGYTDPEENEQAFTDGWFRTGDLAELDAEGRIVLTGRSKDVVITSGGKTINPAAWEGVVERHPVVGHAVVLGDGLAHPEAVILIDAERVEEWAKAVTPNWQVPRPSDVLQEVTSEDVRASIAEAVEAANALVPSAEQVRSFRVMLTDLAQSSGLMTPTQKLRRTALGKRIDELRKK